ncbi:DNA repair protein RecN [Anaeromyxobacter oryzae]|uniref:DNA repair protein RecN n=1 Tax=Anaeromyxobacter oryzae TaxID=2918170 RepID=A0ABN6MV46_9BACT|nr:DNA repair protein RecN [Anaeromyxobacter oryzae]BDG04396.1 DNA repair protein RecN [Anaeromyxobacter oryzae]
MLTTLRISGLAVVDAVEVRFGQGLNVLTGETGAGKSILVNALHLVLGGRMTAEVLREGADEAVVEALFELPAAHPVFGRLEAAGVAPPAGDTAELLVRRVAARGGRGRAFVNGALCTVSMLETALRGVVDISGQHEHVSLLDPATHLDLLDAFALRQARGDGGPDDPEPGDAEPLLRYRAAHAALAALVRERDALAADEGERARRADYLGFQLKELAAVDPRPGELEALEAERRVLASAEKLREAARSAEALAYGEEGSASERVGQAARALAEATLLDRRLEAPLGLLRSAAVELEEAGRELGRYAEAVGGDPERLAEVEDRHEHLKALARKHGGSLEAAIARRAEMVAELARLAGGGDRLKDLSGEIEARGKDAVRLAGALSRAREEAARGFAESVRRELAGLAMGRCRLEVALLPPESGIEFGGKVLAPGGAERAEILISPNPGEPPRPLARIASGGELSRILLAVKRTLARRDPVSTYVFDEVDAGIGGAVAEAMGRVLADVSRGRQVICITHLPQVAVFADRHHRVEKKVAGGRTHTSVALLDREEDRRQEVARMMAGVTVTASALEHAAALIEAARRPPLSADNGRRAAPGRAAARRLKAG